jgi:hypothetical protein
MYVMFSELVAQQGCPQVEVGLEIQNLLEQTWKWMRFLEEDKDSSMKAVIDGQERLLAASYVSYAVYDAYHNNRSWNSEQFHEVELGGVLPVWITTSEKEKLDRLSTFEEVETFAEQLDLKVLEAKEFEAWRLCRS